MASTNAACSTIWRLLELGLLEVSFEGESGEAEGLVAEFAVEVYPWLDMALDLRRFRGEWRRRCVRESGEKEGVPFGLKRTLLLRIHRVSWWR